MTTTDATIQSDEITLSCYLDEVPSFIEPELVRLYNTLHSSLPFFKVFRSMEQLSSYVAWRNKQPIVILLFRYKNRRIEVLNEMIEIDQVELCRFAHYMFAKFPLAGLISFKALNTDTHGLPFPIQKSNAKDTYVIALPDTAKEYTASLGKSTRTTIRYQMNKIVRDHPSFTYRVYLSEEIDAQHICDIIKFSEARISGKTANFSYDEQRIIRLAKMCGFVVVFFIDGRVCAGSVNYRIGSGYFGEVIGQDPAYEKYGLGKLVVYQTICESIVRKGQKFYMGGGRFEFKNRMLGVQQDMDRLDIYRSYAKLALHFDKAAKTAIDGYVRQLKVWLRKHESNLVAQFVFNSFYHWKNVRKKAR